ncbi:MAG: hypothetical protein AAF555_09635 [Verrucomicrobiota bacterium]
MKAGLLFLTAIILGAAGYFGYTNYSTFVETQEEKEGVIQTVGMTDRKIRDEMSELVGEDRNSPYAAATSALKDGAMPRFFNELQTSSWFGRNPDFDTWEPSQMEDAPLVAQYKKLTNERTELATKLDFAQNDIREGQASVGELERDLKVTKAKIAEFEKVFQELQDRFGEGVTPENFRAKLDALEAQRDQLQSESAALERSVVQASEAVEQTERTLSNVRQEDRDWRRRNIEQLEAIVTAVNSEWGYVVINAGKRQGVSGDVPLLVMRNGTLIAKLNVTTIEDNTSVADVIEGSLRGSLTPGDQVIEERS